MGRSASDTSISREDISLEVAFFRPFNVIILVYVSRKFYNVFAESVYVAGLIVLK